MSEQFTLSSTTPQRDAVDVIEEDHRTVEGLFARFEGLRGGDDAAGKRAVVGSIVRELRVHAEVEEEVLYPSIRRLLADGESLIQEAEREHAEAKRALAELERKSPQDPDYDAKVTTLINDVRHHVNEEESEMLPKLRSAVGGSVLTALAQDLEAAKRARAGGVATPPAQSAPAPSAPTPAAQAQRKPTAPARKLTAKKPTAAKKTTAPARKPTARKSTAKKPTAKKSAAKKSTGPRRKPTTRKRTTAKSTSRSPAKRTTATSRKGPRVVYRVKPSDRGWEVTRKGAKRASGTFDRKSEAVARGKELAKRNRRGQLVVHDQGGKIQGEFTYGEDPRSSKR